MATVVVETPVHTVSTWSRPWLSLYNVRLKPKPAIEVAEEDLALIQRLFPDELVFNIFSRLGPYNLGKAACVCKQWQQHTENPRHWEAACRQAFTAAHKSADLTQKTLRDKYRGSWRRMFLLTPHVRYDGLYVSRNTYIRQGAIEWRRQQTTHLVSYFRYYRFFPDGTLLYRTSPHVVSKVAKSMQRNPVNTAKQRDDTVHSGRYLIKGQTVYCVVTYPNSRMTEIRSRLVVRSTHEGANNRLDIHSIYSYDRDLDMSTPFTAPDEDPDGLSRLEHKRGLCSCIFVPWEGVNTCILNKPVSELDFFMTG